jgi:hypothetical protein
MRSSVDLVLTLVLALACLGGAALADPKRMAVCPPPLPSADTAAVRLHRVPWYWVLVDRARALS